MDFGDELREVPEIRESVIEDIYHVKPQEGKWIVDHESEDRIIHVFDEKVDAVKAASEMAGNSPDGRLVIHDSNGNVDSDETLRIGMSLQERFGGTRVFIPVALHNRLSRH